MSNVTGSFGDTAEHRRRPLRKNLIKVEGPGVGEQQHRRDRDRPARRLPHNRGKIADEPGQLGADRSLLRLVERLFECGEPFRFGIIGWGKNAP